MDTTIDALAREAPKSTASAKRAWAGRVLSGLPVLFLIFDVTIKMLGHPAVAEASEKLGLPQNANKPIALLLLACVALYVVKRTAPLGAVLLTGYLGGAILVHVRVNDPLFSHMLFPVYVGTMLWAGLYLRDARVRRLVAAE